MSGNLITRPGDGLAGDLSIVRPQQALAVTESSRTLAEVQAALTVAAARPRSEKESVDRIMVACERPGLAKHSRYAYKRGSEQVTGATIRLMEVIATNWGNIQFGFRELAQGHKESTVEAFAWDMQTNTKRVVTFVVPHKMKAGGGFKDLTDPREIYEWVANQAQRRVRTCLENVIPRDIIDDALAKCKDTLEAHVDVNEERIKKMVDQFATLGVSKKQIENRLQRSVYAITPAQFLKMLDIFASIKDGMSDSDEWFKPVEDDPPEAGQQPSTLAEKVKAKAEAAEQPKSEPPAKQETQPAAADNQAKDPTSKPAKPSGPPKQQSLTGDEPARDKLSQAFMQFRDRMNRTTRVDSMTALLNEVQADGGLSDDERIALSDELEERIAIASEQA